MPGPVERVQGLADLPHSLGGLRICMCVYVCMYVYLSLSLYIYIYTHIDIYIDPKTLNPIFGGLLVPASRLHAEAEARVVVAQGGERPGTTQF